MNFEKIKNTSGLFLGGTYFLIKGLEQGIKHSAKESPVTLLTTSSILLPLSILIGIATKKILDDIGYQPNAIKDWTIYIFTVISSIALASAAAVGFGFTSSLSTGFTVSLIAAQLLVGVGCIREGIENICSDTNHPAPTIL